MGPPLHPSLPPRPSTTSYQPPTTSNRPNLPASVPPLPSHATPLSLPNRPNPPPPSTSSSRPPLASSSSSFFGAAASPKLSASSASSQTGKEYSGHGQSGELPWPRVRGKLTPDEVKVNCDLIELGQGWAVRYKCWKAPAIFLSSRDSSTSVDPNDYDPFLNPNPSTSLASTSSTSNPTTTADPSSLTNKRDLEKEEGPPKKKTRPVNASDPLGSDALDSIASPSIGPPSLPPSSLPTYSLPTQRTDASTSKLDDQLDTLRSAQIGRDGDLFERARRDLIKRGKQKLEEGGDRLDLVCFVAVGETQLRAEISRETEEEVKGKGKGKEKEKDPQAGSVAAVGRTLWAFSVVRGGESESARNVFDELNYDGLECITSGSFDHQSLYPALYPPSSTSNSNPNLAGSSPLTRPAQSFPSALVLSANFLASSVSRTTPLGAAHRAFLSAVEDTIIAQMVASSDSSPSSHDQTTCQRFGTSIVLVPPRSSFSPRFDTFRSFNASPTSPRKRNQPLSSVTTFRTTLQRSTIFVQTRVEELPYRPFPSSSSSSSRSSPPSGYPLLLAPLGLKAQLLRRICLQDETLDHGSTAELREQWRGQLEGSGVKIEGKDWVVCQLDHSTSLEGGNDSPRVRSEGAGREFVWPAELVLIDGTRPLPPPSPETSPDKPPPTDISPDDSHLPHNPLSVTSPDAKFPAAPVTTPETSLPRPQKPSRTLAPSLYDTPNRRRLAEQALRQSRRQSKLEDSGDLTKLPRDPLSRRTNQVWDWMEDETARRETEAADKLLREQKEKEEEEERKRLQEMEKDKKQSTTTRNPPPVTAPINMRTPMSLGTSSTEAPSPADVVYPATGYPTSSIPQQAYLTTPTTTVEGAKRGGDSMEIDGLGLGLYPSPEEGSHSNHALHPPPVSTPATTQPMSSLDSAFASFDWGDGSYGTTGGGGAGGGSGGREGGGGPAASGQDYDDGMDLLGLTDDDFSFFDTAPTPLPNVSVPSSNDMSLSIVQDPFAMSHPSSTSPRFVDHFSHLSATPFASSASPLSPYPAHISPHFALHPSPTASTSTHFPFGAHSNSLGLAGPSDSLPVMPALQPSPPDSLPSPRVPDIVSLRVPSFTIQLADRPFSTSHRRPLRPLPGAFDAIPFAASYSLATEKYLDRRGKFSLPSAESDFDNDGDDDEVSSTFDRHHLSLDSILPRPTSSSLEPWYGGICDPKRAVAERLQRDRRAKEKRGRNDSTGRGRAGAISQPSMRIRNWKRAISRGDEASDGTVTAEEESEEDSDGMEVEQVEVEDRSGAPDERSQALDKIWAQSDSGGIELLALGEFARNLLERQDGKPATAPSIPSTTLQSYEALLILLAEQSLVNPAFATLFPLGDRDKETRLLSTFAIKDVSSSLSAVCSTLSPSPLFADHTNLPPIEAASVSSLVLRSQQSLVQVSTSAVEFWKPMGFEPVTGRKDVTAFAIYEEAGSGMHELVSQWLKTAAAAYQGLRLGEQSSGRLPPSGQFGGTQDGHLALPSGSLHRGLSKEDGKALSTAMSDVSKAYQNIVFYVFCPGRTEPLSTSSPLFTLLHLLQRSKSQVASIVSCPVPFPHLEGGELTTSKAGLDRFIATAFSLYDQLSVPVARLRFPVPETFPSAAAIPNPASQPPAIRLFQSPAIRLSPVRPRKIGFDLNFPVSTLAVQQRHRFLHVCYTSIPANTDGTSDWIHLASIDDTGETWRSVNRLIKTPPGVAADVMRARFVWSIVLQTLVSVDVEWRIVICRLDEPSIVEIRAWDSMLKDQLTAGIRRPLHASFVFADLSPPIAVQPSEPKLRRTSVQSDTISEEGELSLVSRSNSTSASKTDPLFDSEPTLLAFTPSEPVKVIPSVTLFAPASTYLIHVPRIPTFTHAAVDEPHDSEPTSSSEPISIYAVHFLLSHASRTSTYSATLSELIKDVRQSYAELGALARIRSTMNGRLPWHLEAVRSARDIASSFSRRSLD